MAPVMTREELSAAIKALGLSRREFADQIGMALSTINRWLDGSRDVPPYVRSFFDAQNRIRELEAQVSSLRALMYEFERERRAAAAAAPAWWP